MNETEMCFDSLKKALHEPRKKITILTHRSPDGDAMGSSLGLCSYLKKLQHDVRVIVPTDYPESLKWMSGNDEVIISSEETKSSSEIRIKDSDYIFLLDFNTLHRVAPLDLPLQESQATKVMIDHHIDSMSFDLMFSDPSAPSTTTLIFKFIERMGDTELIDQQTATCLYTGMVTDTGSFRYPSVTSETHRIAAKLLDKGVDIAHVNLHFSAIHTEQRMSLLGKTLQNLKPLAAYRTTYMTVSAEDLTAYQHRLGDTEGFVNYGLEIKNIVFSVIFIEDLDQDLIKISFRSRGDFDANFFARKHFQGGGHKNASGGKSEESLSETVQYFLNILPEYEQTLNKT
ncbi:MAG: DHH family phosphoesterase [Flavobacteriales bacterium Tduv]